MAVLVGKKAPNFSAPAVVNGGEIVNDYSLEQFIGKNNVVLFFYPKDFTFVCPSELHAFQAALDQFEAKGTKVVACSTDTEESHWGWLQMEKGNGGIKGVTYPIVADTLVFTVKTPRHWGHASLLKWYFGRHRQL